MCPRNDCVYCEIIELPSGSKLYIHYNSLFTPLWIEFNSDATSINEKYFPENNTLREVHLKAERKDLAEKEDFIDGGYGIRLSRNWEELLRKPRFQMDSGGNIVELEYEELS